MYERKIPVLISDACDDITLTRNDDQTFCVTAICRLKRCGEEVEAVVKIDRANIHIEALETNGDFIRFVIPEYEPMNIDFPEPTEEELALIGINERM